jgi:hypothetical protein
MASTPGPEGIETVFRAIGDQPSLREPLPEEVLRLPEELARVDGLDDPAFSAPYFDPLIGRDQPTCTLPNRPKLVHRFQVEVTTEGGPSHEHVGTMHRTTRDSGTAGWRGYG